MSKILGIALPAVLAIGGAMIGGPLGASAGIGAMGGGAIGGGLGGALGSEITGGNPFTGGIMGALGGGFGGFGAGTSGTLGAGAASGGASGAASVLAGASDPIEALSQAMTMTGTSTATDAATALGYSNVNSLMAAANPSWLNTMPAIQGAANNATGGVIGGGSNIGSFSGTVGPTSAGSPATGGALGRLAAGNTALGPVSSLMSLGSGLYGMEQSQQQQELMKQLAAQGNYGGQYASQLSNLMKNPSSITSQPGYEAGMEAVQRSMAAQGYQGSGNMAAALQKYGGDFFNNQVSQLQGLAQGANQSTAAALQGSQIGTQTASQALAAMGYGAAGLGL